MTIYEKYCELKEKNHVKDSDVAKATKIGKSTFSDWKSGRSIPKPEKLEKIADYFHVSLDYLMRDLDDKNSAGIVSGITSEEAEYLDLLRSATPEAREFVYSVLKRSMQVSGQQD